MRTLGKWIGRLMLLMALAVGAFFVFVPGYVDSQRNAVAEHDPYTISAYSQDFHYSLIIGDWHADPLLWNRDLSKRGN